MKVTDHEDLVKNNDEKRNIDSFYQVDFEYPQQLRESYNYLLFLPEKIVVCKFEKLICIGNSTIVYLVHIENLQQTSI